MKHSLVWALVTLGVLGRIALVVLAMRGPYEPYGRLGGDMGKYLALGVSLSRGEGFSLHYQPVLSKVLHHVPVNPPPAAPTASRSPGYPLFLALLFTTIGYRLYAIVIIQSALSALTAFFVYLTARELEARPLWAFGFALLYYPFAFDAIYLLSECLLTCCTAASLWLLVRQNRGMIAGIVAGFTVLVKSTTLPFFALAPLIGGRRAGAFWAGLAVVLLPWGLRNYLHTGTPYLTPSYAGYQLIQLHNVANRDFPLFEPPGDLNEGYPGLQAVVEEAEDRAPHVADPIAQEYLRDGELSREVVRFVRADPLQFLRAVGRSLMNTWRIDYPSSNRIRWLNSLVLYVGLLPFVLWGSIRAVRQGPVGARLLVAFLVYFVVVQALVASEIRYRVAAMPAYFVLAAYGIPTLGFWSRRPDLNG